ncbi:MAG TPA: threonyl-tRNA synthetase editing domain-containing protein [Candidatus Limnocylindrales bacterium]|nr:threonyl-tRNA synthetase editing domain-containing protein [Candidatus Limnocylindrales bacterium]
MKLLCFQAKRFHWKTHSKTLPEAADQTIDQEVSESVVVFLHAEAADGDGERNVSVMRQTLKHIKWLANKRELKTIVLHSFTHLGGVTAPAGLAETLIVTLQQRLSETGYQVWTTPFGYFCEWDLSVYGESLAKVWKEIH